MRKFRILLLILASAACTFGAQAAGPEIGTLMERARDLFDYGRWSDARHEFLRAKAALTPSDRLLAQEVEFYLAACAVELGSADAEGALREFDERYPGSVYANDVHFALGSFYCSAGNMKKAREAFEKTDYRALSAPRREQYDIRMGYVEFGDGNYAKAYGYFDRIGSRSEYVDHARYYKAYIDYAEGRYGRAKQGFETLARSDAYGDVVPYYLLQIEFREGNYRYVVENGEALARRAVPERRAELERVMAESWFRLEDFNKTLEHLAAFRSAGGEMDRDAAYLEGFSLYRTARYPEAAEWLRKACGAEDALTQNASYHLADCYLRAGDKESAMQAFAMASDESLDAAIAEDALFNYAKLQYELGGGAFNGAINVLTRYVERYPSSPRAEEARTLLIAAYYNSRDYDAAYRAIKAMPSGDADIRAALQKIAYFRGLEAYSSGDLKAAQSYLAESAAVNVSPKYSALTSFWQGEIAFAQGDYAVAAAKYNAYLKRAPRTEREYALAWYNLGYCAFDRNDLRQAQEAFGKFLAAWSPRDSYRADALNRLGDAAYFDRRFEAAVGEYDKAIALGTPEKRYAQYKRAITLGILGHTDQKQQALRQIAAAGGDYADEASYELGRSYIAQEKYAEGAAQLEKFVSRFAALYAGLFRSGAGLPESRRQAEVAGLLRPGGRGVAPVGRGQGRDAVDPRDLRFGGRCGRLFRLCRQGGRGKRPDGSVARFAVVRRGAEALPRRAAGCRRQVAAQLCGELSQGLLPDRCALLPERLLSACGRPRERYRDADPAGRAGYEPVYSGRAGETLRDDVRG